VQKVLITANLYLQLSYITPVEDSIVMNVNQIPEPKIIEKSDRRVSDGLENDFRTWHHQNPVLISAQTGTGKNYFIMERLIPFALETGQQVIIFSNRSALSVQQKKALLHKMQLPDIYTNEQLEQMETFGAVSIVNYQSALNFLFPYNNGLSPYVNSFNRGYVIFDEAHFFLSDALFNADTGNVFQQLLNVFSGYVRIYMTATPDNIVPLINRYEASNVASRYLTYEDLQRRLKKEYESYSEPGMTVYQFPRNYLNYEVYFYADIEQLFDIIGKANHDNKWLCFINSRDRQGTIAKGLKEKYGVQVDCFDRTKKQEEKLWNSLLKGQLPNDILFTTIALDNGVNITDPALHNIVVDSADKVSLLQMIGRKRKKEGETVNLFIHSPSEGEVQNRLLEIKDMQTFLNDFQTIPYTFLQLKWPDFHKKYRNLFYITADQRLAFNLFAQIELNYLATFYNHLLFQIQNCETKTEKFDVYPKFVLDWLGLSKGVQWIGAEKEERAIEDLYSLLEKYGESGIPQAKHREFFEKFREYANIIYNGKDKLTSDYRSGPSIMSSFLEEHKERLGALYKIIGKGNWKIEKC